MPAYLVDFEARVRGTVDVEFKARAESSIRVHDAIDEEDARRKAKQIISRNDVDYVEFDDVVLKPNKKDKWDKAIEERLASMSMTTSWSRTWSY